MWWCELLGLLDTRRVLRWIVPRRNDFACEFRRRAATERGPCCGSCCGSRLFLSLRICAATPLISARKKMSRTSKRARERRSQQSHSPETCVPIRLAYACPKARLTRTPQFPQVSIRVASSWLLGLHVAWLRVYLGVRLCRRPSAGLQRDRLSRASPLAQQGRYGWVCRECFV